ncbi:hypothetical protein HHK36_006259 [Tetracentron sinense]|uniref:PPM-type phosphatase domain-containing protein n=1 Tax=Tetracentron sinense TaxID=13715 RepID=A0A835DP16_TETSI|nr:hypothetical protein HHK36_006259 [Tetracentron sinense]
MGICISVASSEIQETTVGDENVVFVEGTLSSNGIPRLGSLHSQKGSKGSNQDAAILYQGFGMEDGSFCGIFDGHGPNGHIVSKLVRNRLPSLLLSRRNDLATVNPVVNDEDYGGNEGKLDGELMSTKMFNEWNEACVSAFKVMDKELKLNEKLNGSFSGTTAVTIIKQGEDLVIANLGDSRAILGRITDHGLMAVQLTTDLKPSLPREAERIRRSNGRIFALKDEPHIQRVWLPNNDLPGLAMARAFGDFELKDYGIISIPEISYCHLTTSDQFIVLATDGIWDVLSNKEVASIVWSAESEEAAARAVVNGAVAAWKNKYPSSKVDDCTVVCLFLQKRKQHQQVLP